MALAWLGRRWSLLELTWLVYPVMTIGAGKLLWEDLPNGRPLTLFMALALYGGALLVTPRLIRAEPKKVDKPIDPDDEGHPAHRPFSA